MRSFFLFLLGLVVTSSAQAQCNAAGTTSVSGNTLTITNTSTPTAGSGIYTYFNYYWGDGTLTQVSNNTAQSHGYRLAGTYNPTLMIYAIDSTVNPPVFCIDSTQFTVTVAGQPCAVSITPTAISTYNYQFTANNLSSTTGLTYLWYFGDGSTGTGSPASHTYASAGVYHVSLVSTDGTCRDSVSTQIIINPSLCGVSISKVNTTGNTWQFTANNVNGAPSQTYAWSFGDGNTSTGSPVTHTYATAGNFTVFVASNSNGCVDSSTTSISITPPPNFITGLISVDSTNSVDSYQVWLITYDTLTNILAAVDSQVVSVWGAGGNYSFAGHPAGTYRTKAARWGGPTSGTGHVPTYHTASLMWNTATLISHAGGVTNGKNITMQTGTLTSGPGFVGGNVLLGANKGSSSGVEGITMLLLDAGGKLVKYAKTDANGTYSFNDLAIGTYVVYPEDLAYATTAAAAVVSNGQATVTGMNFEYSPKSKTIVPITSGISNINNKQLAFAAYPNPAHNEVTINWAKISNDAATVTITDISGKVVLSTNVNMNTAAKVNVGALNPGMYFLNVVSEIGNSTQKLTIQ